MYLIRIYLLLFFTSGIFSASVAQLQVGAELTSRYLPFLIDKNIAIVANQTSLIGNTHLVDSLLALDIRVEKIFCPEHGFRGLADAGAVVKDQKDVKTGLPIISLYGKSKKPSKESLEDIDVVIFDIQDVGVRFYTYISSLHYVMEACAENNVLLVVLDRPNPNGNYVAGPVLNMELQSFVGMHPVPLVHGMTIGEYALMINGEGWLKDEVKCKVRITKCSDYTHSLSYELKVKPSPNLPNMQSIYLYPSLGLFEGTVMSIGRGTEFPFQVIGHPKLTGSFSFVPKSIEGAASNPKLKGKDCKGFDLREESNNQFSINWIIQAYSKYPNKDEFFIPFFDKLVGDNTIKEKIIKGYSAEQLHGEWNEDVESYKIIRSKYLLYTN